MNKEEIRDLLRQKEGKMDLPIPLQEGKFIDLRDCGHLFVSGIANSGKSNALRCFLASLLVNRAGDVKLFIYDPKRIEYSPFGTRKEMLFPVIYEADEAKECLLKVKDEMERRFSLMEASDCCDIDEYREKAEKLPYIVIGIDEVAALGEEEGVFDALFQILAKGRAAGIHVIATSSRFVALPKRIADNFSARIALTQSSYEDSKRFIGVNDAADMLEHGAGLFRCRFLIKAKPFKVKLPKISVSEAKTALE